MKTTNFDYTGGFPLEQPVLKRMQSGTLLVLESLVKQLGCADTGNFIISGCAISGANITPGIMYINGELCPFAGAIGDNTTKIKKQIKPIWAFLNNEIKTKDEVNNMVFHKASYSIHLVYMKPIHPMQCRYFRLCQSRNPY